MSETDAFKSYCECLDRARDMGGLVSPVVTADLSLISHYIEVPDMHHFQSLLSWFDADLFTFTEHAKGD